MTGPFADRLFRIAFTAAGIYNLAFGLWAAVWPHAFFELFTIAPPRYPGIWACLGMVVGVYGLLYLYAARRLDAAWPIIAVGLLGKVLGPIGMATSWSDDWPRRLGMICMYNDLIWWLPFGLFLVRGTALARLLERLAPWLCAATHVVALAMLATVLRPGTLVERYADVRAGFIAGNAGWWAVGWATWMAAAASLVGFYAWWGSRLNGSGYKSHPLPKGEGYSVTNSLLATVAVIIAWLGLVADFSGEGLLILVLVERAAVVTQNSADFNHIERAFTLLSAGLANGLYTLGGVLLTWSTSDLPAGIRGAMWITWLAGLAMTMAAIADRAGGMMVSTAVLFPLLVFWVVWMGARWSRA